MEKDKLDARRGYRVLYGIGKTYQNETDYYKLILTLLRYIFFLNIYLDHYFTNHFLNTGNFNAGISVENSR